MHEVEKHSNLLIHNKSLFDFMVILINNLQLERILHNLISVDILFVNIFRSY
jgi:hypothetical protein